MEKIFTGEIVLLFIGLGMMFYSNYRIKRYGFNEDLNYIGIVFSPIMATIFTFLGATGVGITANLPIVIFIFLFISSSAINIATIFISMSDFNINIYKRLSYVYYCFMIIVTIIIILFNNHLIN